MLVERRAEDPATGSVVDYDLHGFVGIRLVDPAAGDVAAVTAQLGPIQGPLAREPDIVVRFVEQLPLDGVRYLGVGDAAFSDDGYLVLRSRNKAAARVRIPMDTVGGRCEIVCRSGAPAVPLLIPILNLVALARGVVAMHAAAFTYHGSGVLVTGWAKGGKTEALLAFMAQGAEYVGDEWVYVSADGSELFGIPEPIRIWDWHLDDLPAYRQRLPLGARARMRSARAGASASRTLADGVRRARPLRRVTPLIEGRASIQVPPERLFGARQALRSSFDRLFLVCSHERPDVSIAPVDPLEVARRMVFSLQFERLDLLEHYMKFRFAFPERSNPLLEQAEALQRDALERAFAGKPAHVVAHPYPAPIPALFDAMERYV
jgi:hypothetical protein